MKKMNTAPKGPVFLVGAPRSGTTLLQYMVRSHPSISLPSGESHFIVPFLQRADEFGDLAKPGSLRTALIAIERKAHRFFSEDFHGLRFDLDTVFTELARQRINSMPELIDAVFRLNAKGEGKERWGDKTPYYALHLQLLSESFPSGQFIHIIRDGRDCALSMLHRKYDLGIYNVYDAAFVWRRYVDSAQTQGRLLGPQRYLEFHYESLLQDPRGTMETVCRFLNEPFSESLLNFQKPRTRGKTPLLQKPVQKDNTEKWRDSMPSRAVRIFEAVAGSTLRCNGYRLQFDEHTLRKSTEIVYRIHSRMIRETRKRLSWPR